MEVTTYDFLAYVFLPIDELWGAINDVYPFLALIALSLSVWFLLWLFDYIRGGSA